MRSRVIGVFLLVGLFSVATFAKTGANKHWSMVNFFEPVWVTDRVVMGPVLIVHDDLKMARGEPCTTFYRFVPGKGAQEELVSFHCRPASREVVEQTTFTVATVNGCKRLIDYQIAGDAEVHGVPDK